MIAAATLPGWSAAAAPLRSIAEVLALTADLRSEERTAVVSGVVTLASPHVVIQDGEAAIYVEPPDPPDGERQPRWKRTLGVALEIGEEIEISGAVDFRGFTPRLVMRGIRRLGRRALPAPAAIDFTRLFAGGDDGRRVRVTGVVQAVLDNPEGWSLIFESAARRFRVIVAHEVVPERPDRWIDADVEVVGVCYSYRNSRGEFLAPGMFVGQPDDLHVVRAPADGPFDLPLTPLGRIARFRLAPLGGHRLRTAGVVSFVAPGMLYLQEGIGGVRVEMATPAVGEPDFEAGDRVEVAGFPDVRSGIGAIAWAIARKVSAGPPPEPERIQPSEILRLNLASTRMSEIAQPGSYDGCLIRCRGRVEAVNRAATGTVVTLIDDGSAFTATFLDPASEEARPLVPGSEVEVTGIVEARRKGPGEGDILRGSIWHAQIELLLRGADDIRVIRLPPWWTPARLAAAAAVAAALAIAAFGWVTILRCEVARQTARAVAEESARVEASLDHEITLRERSRLAANLHDTVLQTVTGIGFQVQVCQTEQGRPTGLSPGRLEVVRRMVNHAIEQLRGTVWALHAPLDAGRSLGRALEERLAMLQENFGTPILCRITGRERPVEDLVAANLVLVAQEAAANALRHAAAETIEVVLAFVDDATIRLTIRDDGRGFKVTDRPGPAHGHFGIEGMSDRMQAVGGWCTLESEPGRGTTVTAIVPSPREVDDLSDRTDAPAADRGSMAS